jgi:hypothetical protein
VPGTNTLACYLNLKNLQTKSFIILALDQEKELISWFHGTHADAASSIASGKGIDLAEGAPKKDFSHKNGFYLSDSFKKAQEWTKTKRFAACDFTAILQYKITKVINSSTLSVQIS